MKCHEAHMLISAYQQGTLDEYKRIRLHHHLATCRKCTEEYAMWERGEEYIASNQGYSSISPSSSSIAIMDNVMGRIYQEEKWATPVVKERQSYSKKFKLFFSFLSLMFLFSLILIFATTLIPQNDVNSEGAPLAHFNEWEVNKILLKEQPEQVETSMQFQVVASLHEPIIYLIPGNKTNPPYAVIFSMFGILCIILGMSWLTRV